MAQVVIESCAVIYKGKGGFVTYHLGLAIDSFLDYRDFAHVNPADSQLTFPSTISLPGKLLPLLSACLLYLACSLGKHVLPFVASNSGGSGEHYQASRDQGSGEEGHRLNRPRSEAET